MQSATGPALYTLQQKNLVDSLMARIEQLPKLAQKILALRYCEGMSLAEIAESVDMPEPLVTQIHDQTWKKLRTQLHPSVDPSHPFQPHGYRAA